MYRIYIKNPGEERICIYDDVSPLKELKVSSPNLSLEDNSAGSLTMTISELNPGYDAIKILTTDISVWRKYSTGYKEIWRGRAITDDRDFWNNRSLHCEGALAFLNDTYQPQKEYHIYNSDHPTYPSMVSAFIGALIDIHNAAVPENRQFIVDADSVVGFDDGSIEDGRGTVQQIYRYTNFDTTLNSIIDDTVNKLGGHMYVEFKDDGKMYLRYRETCIQNDTQKIEFGKNITDLTKNWDISEFATAVLALGERIDDENQNDVLEHYTTVDSAKVVADSNSVTGFLGKSTGVAYSSLFPSVSDKWKAFYVFNPTTVAKYGWIAQRVEWDDVSNPNTLYNRAVTYLTLVSADNLYVELNAFDLSYYNIDIGAINFLDKVMVVSKPHGINNVSDASKLYFDVTKLEIPLDAPENSVIGLGKDMNASGLSKQASQKAK